MADLTITSSESSLINDQQTIITFTFDRDVTFGSNDYTVELGHIESFNQVSPRVYRAVIAAPAPPFLLTGTMVVSVAEDTVPEGNNAASISIPYGPSMPDVDAVLNITADPISVVSGGISTVTFTFDQDVTVFTTADITVSDGAKGALETVSARVYRLPVTAPSSGSGDITVSVAEDVVTEGNNADSIVIAYAVPPVDPPVDPPDMPDVSPTPTADIDSGVFQIDIAGIDVTDKLIDVPITIRHATDFPFFSDTEISDVTFDLVSENSEFDPMQPNNWFVDNWNRIDGGAWNQSGYRCPVKIRWTSGSAEYLMFDGVIIDIVPDVETESAIIKCTDGSYQLREAELGFLEDFGVLRYITLGFPNKENVYRLPSTAPPVFPITVSAQLHTTGGAQSLNRVESLPNILRDDCKRLAKDAIDFIVNSNAPSIQVDQGKDVPDTDSISARFREPFRWKRLDSIAKEIVKHSSLHVRQGETDPEPIGIEVPDFEFLTPAMEYASRGRVGWHIEGGKSLDSPPAWQWTGFERDFVVNPENGDAFFLYGHIRGGACRIVHYDYAEDTYTAYPYETITDNRFQSLWRIATADFETFYVLSTLFPDDDATTPGGDFTGYEEGHSYNVNSSQTAASEKPNILEWRIGNKDNASNGWREAGFGTLPQLANYVEVEVLSSGIGGRDHWWADTRRLFHGWSADGVSYLAYIAADGGVSVLNVTNPDSVGTLNLGVTAATSRTGLGCDFAIDETSHRVFRVHVSSTGEILLAATPTNLRYSGNLTSITLTALDASTPTTHSSYLNVTDIVAHNNVIYGVLQFRRGQTRLPGAKLIRINVSGGTATLTSMKEYNYYIASLSGGVVADGKVYYFEGAVEVYGNKGDRSGLRTDLDCPGSVVELSSGMLLYHGLSRSSAYTDDEDIQYDYGAHTGIVAPLRWDGERVHMISGYGDIVNLGGYIGGEVENPREFIDAYTEEGYLLDLPQDDLYNWQWLTLGRSQKLYVDHMQVSENAKAWGVLKRIAEIAYARLVFEDDTLKIQQRSVFEIELPSSVLKYIRDEKLFNALSAQPISERSVSEDSEISVFNVDNYTSKDNLISINTNPTFKQLYNQIKGKMTYTFRGLVSEPPPVLAENKDSIKYIGNKPLDIDVSLMTQHQLWWAKIVSKRLVDQLSELRYDVDMVLTWNPSIRIGDVIRLDVRHPVVQESGINWVTGVLSPQEYIEVQAVEVEHTVALESDSAWTTHVVGRTFAKITQLTADTTETFEPPTPISAGLLAFDSTIDDKVLRIGCEFAIQLPKATGGSRPIGYDLTEIPDGFEFDAETLKQLGTPTTVGTHSQVYTATDGAGATVMLDFDTIIESVPEWVGAGKVGDNFLMLDNPTNSARAHNAQYNRVSDSDISLGSGNYVDTDSDGTLFMALEEPMRRLRFWNASGVEQSFIQLPAGDWVACAMTATRRYVLNKTGEDGICVHGYSSTGEELVAERVFLDFDAAYESMAVHNGTVYILVSGTNVVLAWNLSSKALSALDFKELPKGSTDYVAITVDGGNLYAIRSNSEKPFVVEL